MFPLDRDRRTKWGPVLLEEDGLHPGEAEGPQRKPQNHGREGRSGLDRESRKIQVICGQRDEGLRGINKKWEGVRVGKRKQGD